MKNIFILHEIVQINMSNSISQLDYHFRFIEKCNLCGSNSANHVVMGQRLNTSQGMRPRSKIGISVSVSKCNNCNLVYSNPLPIPFNIQDHYGVPPEEYWHSEYFKYSKEYFSVEIGNAKKILKFKEGMTALDIGAGIGKSMIALKNAGFDTYGLEPSIQFREKAVSELGIDPERIKQGTMEDIEYSEHQFDFISFGAVLEHLYDPADSIEKAMKCLKPGGVIHIEVPSSSYFMNKLTNLYFKLIGTNYVTNLSPMHDPFHLYEFDIKSFEAHAKKNNYSIVRTEYYVCMIYHMPKFLHPILTWYMEKTKKGMQIKIWLQKNS